MATVAFLVHPARPEATSLAQRSVDWLSARGHQARLLTLGDWDRVTENGETTPLAEVDLSGCDIGVSLGGDGTFLRLVPMAWRTQVPIFGVNLGHLGYLLEISPEQLSATLEQALDGRLEIDERAALSVKVSGELTLADADDRSVRAPASSALADGRDEGGGRWWLALNEVVTEKTVPGHTVRLGTSIDGEPYLSYGADGLLVATATGSTAYNLSAGGPILVPQLRAMVVTPVAPHLASGHSLVLGAEQSITVAVLEGGRPAVLVIDGQEVGRLAPGAEITCSLAEAPVRLLGSGGRGFAPLLRSLLGPNRPR